MEVLFPFVRIQKMKGTEDKAILKTYVSLCASITFSHAFSDTYNTNL